MKTYGIMILLLLTSIILQAQEDALTVSDDGKVGIGTSSPSSTLEVKGDVIVRENLECKGKIVASTVIINGEMRQNGNDVVPKGTIIMWYPQDENHNPPPGWAICNRDNSINLEGRFVMGTNNPEEIGKTGGAETDTLTLDNMPKHSHRIDYRKVIIDFGHRHVQADDKPNSIFPPKIWRDKIAENIGMYKASTTEAGAKSEIINENRPPYCPLFYIIKL